jgi:hypothetical protein
VDEEDSGGGSADDSADSAGRMPPEDRGNSDEEKQADEAEGEAQGVEQAGVARRGVTLSAGMPHAVIVLVRAPVPVTASRMIETWT